MLRPSSLPMPIAEVTDTSRLPLPTQDWTDCAITLVELLRVGRAASFVMPAPDIEGPSLSIVAEIMTRAAGSQDL